MFPSAVSNFAIVQVKLWWECSITCLDKRVTKYVRNLPMLAGKHWQENSPAPFLLPMFLGVSSFKTPEMNHLHPVWQTRLTCSDTIAVSMHFRHTIVLKLKFMMQITACYTRNKVTMPIKHGSRIRSRYNYWQHFYAVWETQKVGRLLALSMVPVTTLLSAGLMIPHVLSQTHVSQGPAQFYFVPSWLSSLKVPSPTLSLSFWYFGFVLV